MRILFFAQLKDATGRSEVEWTDGGSLSRDELWCRLLTEFPALSAYRTSVRLARNGAYTSGVEMFQTGDEVALIPPVSGG